MEKIKVLAILPYRKLAQKLDEIIGEFPNIELYTFIGYYKNAIDYTRVFPGKEFDVIISRGGTAEILNDLLQIPIISIDITALDVLRALTEAAACGGRVALISYESICAMGRAICEVLHMDAEVVPLTSVYEIEHLEDLLRDAPYDVVIGGMRTTEIAARYAKHTVLLESSADDVRNALQKAVTTRSYISKVVGSSALFEDVVDKSDTAVLIFSDRQRICYANQAYYDLDMPELGKLLRKILPSVEKRQRLSVVKYLKPNMLSIDVSRLVSGSATYYVFYVRVLNALKDGYPSLSIDETVPALLDCEAFRDEYLLPFSAQLGRAAALDLPVLIEGEAGSGKRALAQYLHAQSANRLAPFCLMDCEQLSEREWKKMTQDVFSPVNSSGYTIFLRNVSALSLPLQKSVAQHLSDSAVTSRNRIIASANVPLEKAVGDGTFSSELYSVLGGIVFRIPPLRSRTAEIRRFAAALLDYYCRKNALPPLTFSEAACQALEAYRWPLNYTQLMQTVRQLALTAESAVIEASDVNAVLRHTVPLSAETPAALDLSGTLDDIERQVIALVLQEEHMNQTAAAKRLNIGRSTLWRKLNG